MLTVVVVTVGFNLQKSFFPVFYVVSNIHVYEPQFSQRRRDEEQN